MNFNTKLSICIPTYNRAAILNDALHDLIEKIGDLVIPIYISDNASTDNTEQIVSNILQIYPHIFYNKNTENIGLDRNFEAVMKMSQTRYLWLLGDDDRIRKESLLKLLDIISNSNHDVIVLNGGFYNKPYVRVSRTPCKVITDRNVLMSDIGWHMTWMSSLIINSKVIKNADFTPFHGTYFLHLGVIFKYLAQKDSISVCWRSEAFFYPASVATLSWANVRFEIFAKQWTNIILSLPTAYDYNIKLKCIKDHGVKSGLFSFFGFINLRAQGCFSIQVYKCYLKYFKFITNIPLPLLMIISFLPKKPLTLIRNYCKKLIFC